MVVDPTDVLLEMLDWKRLSDRRSNHLNILVYKSLTHKLPSNMCNIFNYVSGSHEYSTRAGSQGNLVQISCKNKSDERKFMSRGVVSFNNLPVTAKKTLPTSLSIFKQNVS